MELFTTVNLLIIGRKEKEKLHFLMGIFMKASGIKIWPTDSAFIYIVQELYMKVTGKIIFSMVLEFSYGLIKANIKVIIDLERNMAKEHTLG